MLDLNSQQQMGALRGNMSQIPATTQNPQTTGNYTCLPSDVGCIPAPNPQSSRPSTDMPQQQAGTGFGTMQPGTQQQFQQGMRQTAPGAQQTPLGTFQSQPGAQQFAPGFQQQIPITTLAPEAYDVQYLNQFLATQIGRYVTVDFLIGTSSFMDRSGILLAVGTNYILLQEANTDDILACDFYNIKFVRFYY